MRAAKFKKNKTKKKTWNCVWVKHHQNQTYSTKCVKIINLLGKTKDDHAGFAFFFVSLKYLLIIFHFFFFSCLFWKSRKIEQPSRLNVTGCRKMKSFPFVVRFLHFPSFGMFFTHLTRLLTILRTPFWADLIVGWWFSLREEGTKQEDRNGISLSAVLKKEGVRGHSFSFSLLPIRLFCFRLFL